MVTDLFGTILQELSKALNIPNLQPDRNSSCLIRLKDGLEIQLELDRMGLFLIVGADLGSLPPGKYRENLFREALKANGLPYPWNGILAYSKKTDHLVIYDQLNVKNLTGEKVATFLSSFTAKAKVWKDALSREELPAIDQGYTSQPSSGMFGLRP